MNDGAARTAIVLYLIGVMMTVSVTLHIDRLRCYSMPPIGYIVAGVFWPVGGPLVVTMDLLGWQPFKSNCEVK